MRDFQKDYSFFQDGEKLFEAAMQGNAPRVPVYAQMHEFAMKQIGANATEFYSTPELLAYGTLEISEKIGLDIPCLDYDCYNIEAEALGQKMIWSDKNIPDIDRNQPLINGPQDLDRIKTPDFDNGRGRKIVEAKRLFLEATGLQPALGFCAPFSFAANVRGIEPLLLDLYTDPGFARELFTRATENVIAPWILYQKEHFPDAVSITGSDATASLPIVSPDILREWIIPYILRLRELCGPELSVPNWVGEAFLSDPCEMLDLKLEVTTKYIEGQDPDVETLGPELYKQYAKKHDVPLILGIGACFLAFSKPDQVAERVKYYVESGMDYGRFALYLCNLGDTTPPENVGAAIDAVQTYGVY
jgi:uroporphyrinogen-III decarboxylase